MPRTLLLPLGNLFEFFFFFFASLSALALLIVVFNAILI